MLRTVWQRLTALLAAIATWRYFKPAVFVACAIPLGILAGFAWRLAPALIHTSAPNASAGSLPAHDEKAGETAVLAGLSERRRND